MTQVAGRILLGTSGWSYEDWVGSFYPAGLPAREMLPFVAARFTTVEVDSSFHRVPTEAMIARWREVAPPGFEIALKVPRTVTHAPHGPEANEDFDLLCRRARGLGEHLGPLLMQFPPSFRGDAARKALAEFLPRLAPDLRWAFEARSRTLMVPELFNLLRRWEVGLCITDRVRLPRATVVTANFAYVRLLGDRGGIGDAPFDRVRIDRAEDNARWAKTLQSLAGEVERVYAYFNNHWSGHSPADVQAMMALLGQRPRNPGGQAELF